MNQIASPPSVADRNKAEGKTPVPEDRELRKGMAMMPHLRKCIAKGGAFFGWVENIGLEV